MARILWASGWLVRKLMEFPDPWTSSFPNMPSFRASTLATLPISIDSTPLPDPKRDPSLPWLCFSTRSGHTISVSYALALLMSWATTSAPSTSRPFAVGSAASADKCASEGCLRERIEKSMMEDSLIQVLPSDRGQEVVWQGW
jgi:hypothetical protein